MRPTVLVSIQTGRPAEHGKEGASDPMDRLWTSGFFKSPNAGPVFLGKENLDGDGQADLENHGGPDKAVCVYAADHYDVWRHELGMLALSFGAFGENFTIAGLVESDVCIGDVWCLGEAVVQVTQPRQPCWKLARRWRIKNLPGRVVETGRTGWYLRVLEEGTVAPGLSITRIEQPFPLWTIARANEVMHHDKSNREAAAELAAVPPLSRSWRETLSARGASVHQA